MVETNSMEPTSLIDTGVTANGKSEDGEDFGPSEISLKPHLPTHSDLQSPYYSPGLVARLLVLQGSY